jgi:hypothetical protein
MDWTIVLNVLGSVAKMTARVALIIDILVGTMAWPISPWFYSIFVIRRRETFARGG